MASRNIVCRPVTFRHSRPWIDAWFDWVTPQPADTNEPLRLTRIAVAIVKA